MFKNKKEEADKRVRFTQEGWGSLETFPKLWYSVCGIVLCMHASIAICNN